MLSNKFFYIAASCAILIFFISRTPNASSFPAKLLAGKKTDDHAVLTTKTVNDNVTSATSSAKSQANHQESTTTNNSPAYLKTKSLGMDVSIKQSKQTHIK